ncbi:MAG: PIN domain-containing protein [Candidatus Dormibacteraceae bacterium]
MTVCLDSWAVIAWLDGDQPAETRVRGSLPDRPVISWVNVVEVICRVERRHGRATADLLLERLRQGLDLDLPGVSRMIEAARLKARVPMALADCFAVVTAAALGLTLLTGDPEIIDAPNLPCAVEDLRGSAP